MSGRYDLTRIKEIPILDVASRLKIEVKGTKAMCFTGHDKATPSLSFHREKNTWKCFGACGKGGDGITLVMETQELDFNGALGWFAENFGIDVTLGNRPRKPYRRRKVLKRRVTSQSVARTTSSAKVGDRELFTWFIDSCSPIRKTEGLEYLESHSISLEQANSYSIKEVSDPKKAIAELKSRWGSKRLLESGIAYGSNGVAQSLIWYPYAVLFPFIQDATVTYIQGRLFNCDHKFLNPSGVMKPLFNRERLADLSPGSRIHICEGVPDTLALEGQNLPAVGVLGASSFRSEWIDLFMNFSVSVVGDGDSAGEKFINDVTEFFRERGKPVNAMPLPRGLDASDVITQGNSDLES